jgi:hypothetical protein
MDILWLHPSRARGKRFLCSQPKESTNFQAIQESLEQNNQQAGERV